MAGTPTRDGKTEPIPRTALGKLARSRTTLPVAHDVTDSQIPLPQLSLHHTLAERAPVLDSSLLGSPGSAAKRCTTVLVWESTYPRAALSHFA